MRIFPRWLVPVLATLGFALLVLGVGVPGLLLVLVASELLGLERLDARRQARRRAPLERRLDALREEVAAQAEPDWAAFEVKVGAALADAERPRPSTSLPDPFRRGGSTHAGPRVSVPEDVPMIGGTNPSLPPDFHVHALGVGRPCGCDCAGCRAGRCSSAHVEYCNLSSENQARGLAQVCNYPGPCAALAPKCSGCGAGGAGGPRVGTDGLCRRCRNGLASGARGLWQIRPGDSPFRAPRMDRIKR